MKDNKQSDFATRAVHAGQSPEPLSGAITTPIYQTSTYVQQAPGVHKGYEYARTGNPTRQALEDNLAALENGSAAFAFGSGMAATSTVMGLLAQGDHVIVTQNVYGGTFRYFQQVMTNYGLSFSFVDTSETDNIAAALRPETRMVFLETPTNPLLQLTDLRHTADLCRSHDLLLAVDNTFMSPYFQRPLDLGADIVVHSSSKYINGHADIIGGIIIVKSDKLAERFAFLQNAVGAVPSPFDCWLTLRSIKTLPLRMQQQNSNAIALSDYLLNHPKVNKVIYPGLASHPHHELACKQQLDPYGKPGFGGMISFELKSEKTGSKMLEQLQLFSLAESLGGVESLISQPASMTHASVPKEERERIGLSDNLIRISAGIEHIDDLIADLAQALK